MFPDFLVLFEAFWYNRMNKYGLLRVQKYRNHKNVKFKIMKSGSYYTNPKWENQLSHSTYFWIIWLHILPKHRHTYYDISSYDFSMIFLCVYVTVWCVWMDWECQKPPSCDTDSYKPILGTSDFTNSKRGPHAMVPIKNPEKPEKLACLHLFVISSHVYGKFVEKICLKAPYYYFAPIWTYNFSICLWENLKLLSSMISEFGDVSLSPKTIYFIFGDTRTPKNKQEQSPNMRNILFLQISTFWNSQVLIILAKTGAEQSRRSV